VVESSIKILDDFKSIFTRTKEMVRNFNETNNLKERYKDVDPQELDWE